MRPLRNRPSNHKMMSTLFSIAKRRSHVRRHCSLCVTILLFVFFACALTAFNPMPATAKASSQEDAVRKTFAELQAAVKAKDADKLWALLSTKSREDAERVAKTVREAYAKSDASEKGKQEKVTG